MWKTTSAGIAVIQAAVAAASAGSAREDGLDALNGWLGTSIRLKVRQTVSGTTTTYYEATHATGCTRTLETLSVPTSSWTVVTNTAFTASAGTTEVVIEKSTDATKYIRHVVSDAEAVTLDQDFNGIDAPTLDLAITLANVYDAASDPTPPDTISYQIFKNTTTPRPISDGVVGMHLHRYPSATNPSNPSTAPTYAYGAVRTHNTANAQLALPP